MSKAEWKKAKAELDAIEKEREALLAPTKERYDAACEKLDEAEEALENDGSFLVMCEGCGEPIFDDEPYTADSESSIYNCLECSPTYQDVLDHPEHFESRDGNPMTAKQAKALTDAHIASGGKLSDSMAR